MPNNKSFIVTLEEDPITKDLVMPFPTEVLSQMGWSEGTDLWWDIDNNGKIVITEVKKENNDPLLISTVKKG